LKPAPGVRRRAQPSPFPSGQSPGTDRLTLHRTAHREREALRAHERAQCLGHLVAADRHQLLELELGRDLHPELQLLAGDVVHARGHALLPHQHRALDLHLRRLDLVRARALGEQPVELLAQELERLARLVGRDAEIDADRAAVAQEVERRGDEVGEPGVLADALEEPRAHAATQERLATRSAWRSGAAEARPRAPSDR
jgi:hypothetical protein